MKKIIRKNIYIEKQKGKIKLAVKNKNYRIKHRRKKIKNKIFLKSLRRPRPKFKFLCYNNKFRYRAYIASFKNCYLKQKYKRGVVSPKYQIKNYLEKVSKLNRSLFKSRDKRFSKLQGRRYKKFYYRKGGLHFLRRRRKVFKFNMRILLFKRIKKKKNLKVSKKKKLKNKKKINKQKKKLIKMFSNLVSRNCTVNVDTKLLTYSSLKTRRYLKKKRKKLLVFKIIQKILKYINVIKIGAKKKLKKRYQNKIIKSILTLGFVPNSIFIMLPKFLVGVTGKKKIRNFVLQNKKYKINPKRIWNLVYQCILQHFLKTPNISSNLTKHYKLKIKELQAQDLIIGVQRQANTLNLINLIIAKKRKKIQTFVRAQILQIQNFILNENFVVTKDNFHLEHNSDMGYISILQANDSLKNKVLPLITKFKASFKETKKEKLLNKYLFKNRILKKRKQDKKASRTIINKLPKKKKKKEQKIDVKVTSTKVGKKKINKRSLHKKQKVSSLFIVNIWKGKLLKKIRKTLKFLYKNKKRVFILKSKQIKKNVQKNKKIKKNFKKKGVKFSKKKNVWLSKKNAFKKNRIGNKPRKKKKGRRKRGRKNIEKRRRLQKIAYFIRPRILTQAGYHAYAKHSNSRGLLKQFLNKKIKKVTKLKKKSYTKEKKKRLLIQLLNKYFQNENKNKILKQLKGLNLKKIVHERSTRYYTANFLNFIKEYMKTFYIILDSANLLQLSNEKAILNHYIKNNKGALLFQKMKKIRKKKFRIKNLNGKKIVKSRVIRKKGKISKNVLRNLVKKKINLKTQLVSNWALKRTYRNFLEHARKAYSKGDIMKTYYKKIKIKIKRTKFISRKILKAHRKAKRKGKPIQKNLIKASYYYYFKKLRYDRILLDKLNYKTKGLSISSKGKLQLSKFIIYLLMRVYLKKTALKRTNVRLGIKRIKRETKKQKITKKIRITAQIIKNYTRQVSKKSKKYLGLLKKTVLIKVLIKLLRSMLRSTVNNYRERARRKKIKEIIKIFVYPLLINKRQIQKVRLRKKNKIYLIMAQIFLYNIKQIVNSANYSINFFGLIGSNITAAYVMRRLMERLEKCKGGGLWFIPKVMKKIMNSKHVVGFKIKFSGRLTGNSMAQQSIMKKGIIGNSNMNVYIDYVQDNIIRKHGKCGLKIWIVRNLLTYMPYKYVYTYNYKR